MQFFQTLLYVHLQLPFMHVFSKLQVIFKELYIGCKTEISCSKMQHNVENKWKNSVLKVLQNIRHTLGGKGEVDLVLHAELFFLIRFKFVGK